MLISRGQNRLNRLRAFYHRLPLPAYPKKRLAALYRSGFLRGLRGLRRILNREKAFSSPATIPQKKRAGLPDYIVWGAIDWDFRYQRPQQIAQALSCLGRRVIYISATLKDASGAGFTLQPLDEEGRLFQVSLFARGAPVIYSGAPDTALVQQLCRSIGEVLVWAECARVISLVQHPFWCDIAKRLPNSKLVYDCMDHHQGFGNNTPDILQLERRLVRDADIRLFTSDWLAQQWTTEYAGHSEVIRNAADFALFSSLPTRIYRDRLGRSVIGYYGAIADWFDHELVASIAQAFPQQVILLIGADTVGARQQLRRYANVEFIGEVPYADLPHYLHAFDVCIVPFYLTPLTLATNPVKVYEYLSAGKPVVSVDLPEMQYFDSQVQTARNYDEFIAAIALALAPPMASKIAQRQAFAAKQTWAQRADSLIEITENQEQEALISVIVVTYNNLALTRACLDSIAATDEGSRLEIIVVDNASSDSTPEFLMEWAADSGHKVILNNENRGFAAANNQGLAIARGDYLALLNNDTQVTAGWASTLQRHLLRNPHIGLIGPVTNNIGNQAKIDLGCSSLVDMPQAVQRFTCQHLGELLQLPTLGFFCVMFARSTFVQVGPLDEAFGLGFFEDDDYCRRVEKAGLSNACARDVFVYHQLSASFEKMEHSERKALFEKNKAIYETKWGKWTPHTHE